MAQEPKLATISRVVPGRVVYVKWGGAKNSYAFKLDRIEVCESDGSRRPYRGEPMSEIGLNVGQKVCVFDDDEPFLVVDPNAKISGLGAWKVSLKGMFGSE